MDESLFDEQRREGGLNSIYKVLQGWVRYYDER